VARSGQLVGAAALTIHTIALRQVEGEAGQRSQGASGERAKLGRAIGILAPILSDYGRAARARAHAVTSASALEAASHAAACSQPRGAARAIRSRPTPSKWTGA
jgi:hypothetical protein